MVLLHSGGNIEGDILRLLDLPTDQSLTKAKLSYYRFFIIIVMNLFISKNQVHNELQPVPCTVYHICENKELLLFVT